MNDAELKTLFAATEVVEEPALPPEYVEQTLIQARRSVRRRRGIGAAALAVALVAALLIGAWSGGPRELSPAGEHGQPSFPAEFAGYSSLTSRVVDRPAGRAIALYEYGSSELFTSWQTLVVGADRDSYRRLDAENESAPAVLLSPDGSSVMFFKASRGTDEFTLLDLSTGRSSVRHSVEWVSNVGASITMLAWSPDGRYLAYAVPAPPPADGTAASSFRDGAPIRNLAILDVVSDTTDRYDVNAPIFGASFSSDSQRIALVTALVSPIVSVRGEELGTWSLPLGVRFDLANFAWSPDGALMATVLPIRWDGSMHGEDARVRFVDMTGTDRSVPTDLPYGNVLGWRSATSIIVLDWLEDEDRHALVEVSTVDGGRTVLSRFSREKDCEYGLLTCNPYRIQLATDLIASAGVRPSDPDRGPWVPLMRIGSTVLVLVLVGAVVGLISRRNRRRRGSRHRA
jgi:hypothetical protein